MDGVGFRPEHIERQRDRLQLGRADVRTVCIAEIDQNELAAKIRIGASPPTVIDEGL